MSGKDKEKEKEIVDDIDKKICSIQLGQENKKRF